LIATTVKRGNKNISLLEKITSHTKFLLRTRLRTPFICAELYQNCFDISIRLRRKKYPIEAILRNGYHITLENYADLVSLTYFLSLAKNHPNEVEFDFKENKTTFLSLPYATDNSRVMLYGSITNGDAVAVFLDNIYGNLPVLGKTVIDIGANIADSAIYFAVRGAKKVIGLEPFPKHYELAKRNIESNNLSDKITLVLAACGANRGFVNISPSDNDKSWIGSSVKNSNQGFKVPTLTLEDILKQNNLQNGELNILKMDCEGCEYDSILSASRDVLRSFSHIQIEYHYGYKDLKQKLEENGFIVSVSKPTLVAPEIERSGRKYFGDIYARLA
jgi:FkbM family methyltransferase